VTEVTVDADVPREIRSLKFLKMSGAIEAVAFIGAETTGPERRCRVGNKQPNGFVASCATTFSAYSKRTSPAGVSLDGFGGTVEEAGLLACSAGEFAPYSGLRAGYLLARARENSEFGDKDKSSELVKVHNQSPAGL